MGCNCGKSATPPTGSSAPEPAATVDPSTISAAAKAPAGQAVPATRPTQQSFSSNLAANAARVRAGRRVR